MNWREHEDSYKNAVKQFVSSFTATAGWSFDPIAFGFAINKHFNRGLLDPIPANKFCWVAEKVIRWRHTEFGSMCEICDFFTIKKNLKSGRYLIKRERRIDRLTSFDHPTKNREIVVTIINHEHAKATLKNMGALRKNYETN